MSLHHYKTDCIALVDTVWNHMAGIDSGTGTAGDSFTHYSYPPTWDTSVCCPLMSQSPMRLTVRFSCHRTSTIVALPVTTFKTGRAVLKSRPANFPTSLSTSSRSLFPSPPLTVRSLHSLATETETVRAKLAAFGNDLMSLGVDGLRLDAAKREPPFAFARVEYY